MRASCAKTFAQPPASLSQPRTWTRVSKNLDEIDLKILNEIQADGRITNVELAKRVGISPPPCLRRVRTLEEAGYILGYRGLLDPRRLGFGRTGVPFRAPVEPGRSGFARVRGIRPRRAVGAGMLDAVGRGRLYPQMRRTRHGDVSGFRHPSDRRTPCAKCQGIAGAAQFQIRGRGPARIEGRGLMSSPVIPRRR